MTQQEYDNKIKELQDELDQLKAAKIEAEQLKRWKPKIRELYYCINCGGALTQWYWLENDVDEWLYLIGNCFKTKEEAEWHHKTYAERTERFEPPMWEEIEDEYKLGFVEQPDKPIYFYVGKKINVIFIRDVYEDELIEVFDATKENYIKACEMVRDLFKGEK